MTTEAAVDALIWGEAGSGRRFLEKLLQAEGFSVEASSLLSEIVPPCMNRKYRMILVTLGLAESIDSKQLAEHLRVVHEIDPLVPIVVVSEAISLEVERMLRREGIFYFLSRPFASSELIEVVRCAVQKRKRFQGG